MRSAHSVMTSRKSTNFYEVHKVMKKYSHDSSPNSQHNNPPRRTVVQECNNRGRFGCAASPCSQGGFSHLMSRFIFSKSSRPSSPPAHLPALVLFPKLIKSRSHDRRCREIIRIIMHSYVQFGATSPHFDRGVCNSRRKSQRD